MTIENNDNKIPLVTIAQAKKNISGIDLEDDYFDDEISIYITAATEFLKEMCADSEKVNEAMATCYILAMVNELFNNRELTVKEVSNNKVLNSLLFCMRY